MRTLVALVWVLLSAAAATTASAQTPRAAPRPQFVFHDERAVGALTVQRWINEGQREVSPSGMCECLTTVYLGDRLLLTLGQEGLVSAIAVADPSGRDITGDGSPDVVVTDWSGGAHCCFSASVYSVEAGMAVREIYAANTGSCVVNFEDLDGDRRLELVTCEDGWESDNCSFAEAPFAPVVFAYSPSTRAYVPATPRYRTRYTREVAEYTRRAEVEIRERNGRDPGLDKCAVLAPVLPLLYTGRTSEGIALLRRLYRHPDRGAFEAADRCECDPVRSGSSGFSGPFGLIEYSHNKLSSAIFRPRQPGVPAARFVRGGVERSGRK